MDGFHQFKKKNMKYEQDENKFEPFFPRRVFGESQKKSVGCKKRVETPISWIAVIPTEARVGFQPQTIKVVFTAHVSCKRNMRLDLDNPQLG